MSKLKTAIDFQLEVDVALKDREWRILVPNIRAFMKQWCHEAMKTQIHLLPPSPLCMSIVLTNDRFIQRLNRDFRGKDMPTNVLSFSSTGNESPGSELDIACGPVMIGDIVLAKETILREAMEQGKPLLHHLAHLVVHGCLHLCGYDHETEAEAESMEKIEIALLKKWNISNPYRLQPSHS